MVVVFNPSRLGGSKEPDHRRFSLRMCLQVFRHHDISRARQRQSRVVVQFQHLGSTVQDMRGGDVVVHLDIEEVL
jgi:hypothetical protein